MALAVRPCLSKTLKPCGKLPHVAVVSPVNQNILEHQGHKVEIIYGIDYPTFDALKPFQFVAGGPFQAPYDAIVDDILASSNPAYHVGGNITIMNHTFRISGVVEHGKGGRKLIPIDTMGS